jgi:NADH:ubiquinone oxidoreductase subunit K
MAIGNYLLFSIMILFLGLYCVITKKSLIKSAIGISIMVKGASLSFLATGGTTAQVVVVLIIIVDAIVAAILLSLAVNVYRRTGSLSIEDIRKLWG